MKNGKTKYAYVYIFLFIHINKKLALIYSKSVHKI